MSAPGMDAILDFKFVPWGNGRVFDPETQQVFFFFFTSLLEPEAE